MASVKPRISQSFSFETLEETLDIKPKGAKLHIGIPKETAFQENRIALIPEAVAVLVNNGDMPLARAAMMEESLASALTFGLSLVAFRPADPAQYGRVIQFPDGTLDRIHQALYVQCRELAEREASPTAAIIDSQSVKSAEKGGSQLTRPVTMQAKRSKARNAISW